jgi:hypothetical protein
MAGVNRFGFLAIAVAFHLIYIYSIFDIYFVSPIVSGMREYGVERPKGVEAPAKRLVLFVGKSFPYVFTIFYLSFANQLPFCLYRRWSPSR